MGVQPLLVVRTTATCWRKSLPQFDSQLLLYSDSFRGHLSANLEFLWYHLWNRKQKSWPNLILPRGTAARSVYPRRPLYTFAGGRHFLDHPFHFCANSQLRWWQTTGTPITGTMGIRAFRTQVWSNMVNDQHSNPSPWSLHQTMSSSLPLLNLEVALTQPDNLLHLNGEKTKYSSQTDRSWALSKANQRV